MLVWLLSQQSGWAGCRGGGRVVEEEECEREGGEARSSRRRWPTLAPGQAFMAAGYYAPPYAYVTFFSWRAPVGKCMSAGIDAGNTAAAARRVSRTLSPRA